MRRAARSRGRLGTIWPLLTCGLAAALACGCSRAPTFPHLPTGTQVALFGHEEVEVAAGGNLLPVEIKGLVGVCLTAPSSVDTSRWVARLELGGVPLSSEPAEPVARSGSTVCFAGKAPDSLEAGAIHALCGVLTDRYDNSHHTIPCRPLRHRPGTDEYEVLFAQMRTTLNAELDLTRRLAALDGLAARAVAAGYAILEVRLQLIAVYFLKLEGSASALVEAQRRLDQLPAWLDREEAAEIGAVAAYEQACVSKDGDHPRHAWRLLGEAARRGRRIASPRLLLVSMLQSDILADEGALGEATRHLSAALDGCVTARCEPRHVALAREQLAWHVLSDPDASAEELERTRAWLIAASETPPASGDPLEQANSLINLALLEVRQGSNAEKPLARARELARAAPSGESRRRFLLGWIELVAGLGDLDGGRVAAAIRRCSRAAALPEYPDLAARGWTCCGRAWREQGEPARAAAAIERALALRRLAPSTEEGQRAAITRGNAAEDAYWASRIALDAANPERAFAILAELDAHLAAARDRTRCREKLSTPDELSRWHAAEQETARILAELASLETPASSARRAQIDRVRGELMEALRTAWHEFPGCGEWSATNQDGGEALRAFTVGDAIFLLGRDSEGRVRMHRETRMPRAVLRNLVKQLSDAVDRRVADEHEWTRLARPLADALLPPELDTLGEITVVSLHGVLHAVPMAALPLPPNPQGSGRWLADVTTVVYRPAGAWGTPNPTAQLSGRPLIVADPLGDLAHATAQATTLAGLLPNSILLRGGEARRARVLAELGAADWLHFDGHGRLDPAFPDLSSLVLADGGLTLANLEMTPLAASFANLSACQTGHWPDTNSSGQLGLAGALARRGVGWVIASRSDLDDEVAASFNQTFYRYATTGTPIPQAYGHALRSLAHSYPPSRWAGLLLLAGSPLRPSTGESRPVRDSLEVERP